jgi:DNA polymerase-3 subunit alpha
MPALALTDYNNMYGTIEFYKACEKEGLKAIIGAEFDLAYDERKFKVVLIAKNLEGYKNLMRIVSIANVENPIEPTLTQELLFTYKTGLIVLSGGQWGEVSNLLAINESEARSRLEMYKKEFGDDFYLEINPQTGMEHGDMMRQKTIELARSTGTPLVATWNTHYLTPNDKPAHKTLYLVHGDERSQLQYAHTFQKDDFSFVDVEIGEKQFSDAPEALANTLAIVEKCDVKIPLGAWVFPNIEFKKSYDEDVRELAHAGLEVRGMELTDQVRERLDYELKVISDKGYSPYFLVVYDLLRFARENNILTNIRGSVAGSLVTYLLQITKCNPFEYKLPFERFLNPERPSAPDIDMDYADTQTR